MEKSSKRGKIPQQDWPSIITRYEAGETLASIARTYDCSPPAISYIVSRTRARSAAAGAVAPTPTLIPSEPQLIKAAAPAVPASSMAGAESTHNGAVSDSRISTVPDADPERVVRQPDVIKPSAGELFSDEPRSTRAGGPTLSGETGRPAQAYGPGQLDHQTQGEVHGSSNGAAPRAADSPGPAPQNGGGQNGGARRTLHLSLPQAIPGHGGEADPAHDRDAADHGADTRMPSLLQTGPAAVSQNPRQAGGTGQAPPFGAPPHPVAARAPGGAPGELQRPRETGAYIDQALRERIDGDIAAFLAAFDNALDHDTTESRTGLREATDRLLRAGARTRIELERLEARVPLGAREKDSHTAALYRQR